MFLEESPCSTLFLGGVFHNPQNPPVSGVTVIKPFLVLKNVEMFKEFMGGMRQQLWGRWAPLGDILQHLHSGIFNFTN